MKTTFEGERSRVARIDGIRHHWFDSGRGRKHVVLVHGIPTSPRLWRYVVPLVQGARVHNWEMIGYGDSILEGEGRDISVARQAEYLRHWMDHEGIDRAVLAGHDLGGGVAQILAAKHPERVSGIFLTNSIGYDSWPVPSVNAMKATRTLIRSLPEPVFKQVHRNFVRRGHDNAQRATASHLLHFRPYHESSGAQAFAHQIHHLHTEDTVQVQDDIMRLRIPARVVWGADDQFQKVEYGERFAEDLGTTLIRIDGGKHFTPEDHPEVVARAINEVVAEAKA